MALKDFNQIHSAPTWAKHREGLSAADNGGTLPLPAASLSVQEGVKSDNFLWGLVRVRETVATVSGLKVRPVFWDEIGEQWIIDPGIEEMDLATADQEFSFEAYGRTFAIVVTAIAAGTIAIDISGYGRTP